MAMETWGKWFSRDIDAQLGTTSCRRCADTVPTVAATMDASAAAVGRTHGFDAHSWLRVCGLPCVVGRCTLINAREHPALSPCFEWLQRSSWHTDNLAVSLRTAEARLSSSARRSALYDASQRSSLPSPYKADEWRLRSYVTRLVPIPHVLEAAAEVARTTHPRGLVAFKYPIAAADRREYQLHVHLLMSASMLTQRVPVLPMALCAKMGEWSSHSRCVYVLHAKHPKGAQYCVQRPPSPCHGRVALPNELENVPPMEVAEAVLPRLPLVNGTVDVMGFGQALRSAGNDHRVLLLDITGFRAPDDISHLLATPKGWLCTLEHKSCQHAC